MSGKTFEQIFAECNAPATLEHINNWQRIDYCGINCIYAFCRMQGKDISLSKVTEIGGAVPENGYSLLQLRNIAARLGVKAKVVFKNPELITKSELPAVIHIGRLDAPGHFVCLYRLDKSGTIGLLDGTSGAAITLTQAEFSTMARECSGFVLIADSAYKNILSLAFLILAALPPCHFMLRKLVRKRS